MTRFTGRAALVTGAGAGFGRATAVAFAREGASHVGVVDRYPDRLEAVCADIETHGANPHPITADLHDADTAAGAVKHFVAAAGALDILVSNHVFMGDEAAFLDGADAQWDRELAVNLTSHYVLGRSAALVMREQRRGGSIGFTASVDALGAERGFTGYCVTKAGLVALARVMAAELADYGIRVNCVSPGPGDTPGSTALVGEELMEHYRREGFSGVPLKRLTSVDDVAEAFLYLASDAASFVTGHNLVVDGGLTIFAYQVPEQAQ